MNFTVPFCQAIECLHPFLVSHQVALLSGDVVAIVGVVVSVALSSMCFQLPFGIIFTEVN